eukprot:ctg_452.g216
MEAPDPDLSGSLSGIGLDERGAPAMDEKSTEQTGGSLQEDVRAADSADETEVMDRRTAQATLTGDRRENEEHNGMQRLLLQWERLNRGDAALSDEWLTQPPLADVLSTSARLRSPPDNDARLEQWLQQALSTLNAVSRWELRTAEASAENSSAAHDASVVLRELFDVLYQAERAVHVLETQREGVSVPDARQHRIRTRTWQQHCGDAAVLVGLYRASRPGRRSTERLVPAVGCAAGRYRVGSSGASVASAAVARPGPVGAGRCGTCAPAAAHGGPVGALSRGRMCASVCGDDRRAGRPLDSPSRNRSGPVATDGRAVDATVSLSAVVPPRTGAGGRRAAQRGSGCIRRRNHVVRVDSGWRQGRRDESPGGR